MFDTAKRDALIDEGLTEAEANYLVSGGTQTEGLTPPPGSSYFSDTGDGREPAAHAAAAGHLPRPDADAAPRPDGRQSDAHAGSAAARDRDLAELDRLREIAARQDERLRIFGEAMQEAAAPQPRPKPDREADPFAYMAWLEEQLEGLRPQVDALRRQTQERDAFAALQSAYVNDARAFASRTPDFPLAYNWLMQNRDAELAAAGYNDPGQRMRIIALDERDIVARALQARQSPAQVIYGLARARGFRGAQAAAAAGQRGAAAPQGGFDLARIAAMTDGQYLAWKRALTPQQRRAYNAALGGA